MKKIFSLSLFFLFSLFLLSSCGGKGKTAGKELNPDQTLSLFGSSLEAAADKLEIELEKIEGSESSFQPLPDGSEAYQPTTSCSIAGFPADMEFLFYTQTTPAGAPIGLCAVSIKIPAEEKPDLKKVLDFLKETYTFENCFISENNGETTDSDTVSEFTILNDSQRDVYTEGSPLKKACEEIFGTSPAVSSFYLNGRMQPEGNAFLYIDARGAALYHHKEDYAP